MYLVQLYKVCLEQSGYASHFLFHAHLVTCKSAVSLKLNTDIHNYSRLPIIGTFKGNRKKFELSGVQVIKGKII